MGRFFFCWLALTAAVVAGLSLASRANMVQMPTGGAAPTQSAFNPSDKSASIVLSTTNFANDTATDTGTGAGWVSVRGTSFYAASGGAKVVFNMTITAQASGVSGVVLGLGDNGMSLANYTGNTNNSIGIQVNGSASIVYKNGAGTATPNCASALNPAQGTVIWLATDFGSTANHIYCSTNCTTWYDNAGAAQTPSSGGGAPVTLPALGNYFITWSGINISGNPASVLNTKPSLASCTGITGFTTWN